MHQCITTDNAKKNNIVVLCPAVTSLYVLPCCEAGVSFFCVAALFHSFIVALLHCIISRIIQLLCCHKVVLPYVVPFLHLCAVYCYCSPVILSHFNIVILLHCHTFVMWPCTDADVVLTHCVM